MATATSFAYNTGAPILGTEQIGNLSIGVPTSGFTDSPQYWNGPNQDLGFVITKSVSGNTQPTPVTTNRVYLSSTFRGNDIVLSNNGQTASQQFGYQQSVLGISPIGVTDKVMFSVLCTLVDSGAVPDSHFVGIGYTTMNYSGNPYGGFPGTDNQSIGYGSGGDIWYAGGVYSSGLQTWGNNDIIDIVIDNNTSVFWVRVNGGNWNNNEEANPTTGDYGIEIINGPFYPVLCPGYEGTMIIQNYPKYGIPSGYNFLATLASVGFNRSKLKTQSSFLDLTNTIFNQNFTGGTQAKEWLNTNGYWTSYSEYIVSSNKTSAGGYTVGGIIQKDMQIGGFNYVSQGTPNNTSFTLSDVSYWNDWEGDIFDSWGYFYLYDPNSNNYLGLIFTNVNQPDGVFDTQVFTFNGRTFTIKQGYPVQGIFKFEIRVNDNLPFIFGEAGNMGSDGSTVNTNQSYNYTLDGTNLTLWYNENYQSNRLQERFYSYYVPFNVDQNELKTYVDYLQPSDNLYLYSVECNNGLTVYHSKENDVKEWVVYDLTFGN